MQVRAWSVVVMSIGGAVWLLLRRHRRQVIPAGGRRMSRRVADTDARDRALSIERWDDEGGAAAPDTAALSDRHAGS
jgi:hypothetical protein